MQERGPAPALNGGAPPGGRRRAGLAAAVAALVIAADQATKSWAVHRLSRGPVHVVWKLDFELAFNRGASFSLFQGWAPVIAGVAVLLVAVLVIGISRARSRPTAIALGLVVGGAISNLADRVLRGYHGAVVDFIALHFWPTFNVADASIVVGAAVLALTLWHDGRRPSDQQR